MCVVCVCDDGGSLAARCVLVCDVCGDDGSIGSCRVWKVRLDQGEGQDTLETKGMLDSLGFRVLLDLKGLWSVCAYVHICTVCVCVCVCVCTLWCMCVHVCLYVHGVACV